MKILVETSCYYFESLALMFSQKDSSKLLAGLHCSMSAVMKQKDAHSEGDEDTQRERGPSRRQIEK